MESSACRQIVDARYLDPPEPFMRTMDALDTLAPGERLLILLFREPHPLYKALKLNGYRYQTRLQADGTFEIEIWRD